MCSKDWGVSKGVGLLVEKKCALSRSGIEAATGRGRGLHTNQGMQQ
jgi:hypothetical protein